MVARGLTNSAIAGKLEPSPWTVLDTLAPHLRQARCYNPRDDVAVIAAADNPAGDAIVPYRTARPEPTPAARHQIVVATRT